MADEEPIVKTLGKLCLLWVPAMLSTGAFVCSMIFAFWCESIVFEAFDPTIQGQPKPDDLYFGPWYQMEVKTQTSNIGGGYTTVTTQRSCKEWQGNPSIDSKWKTVRAMTVLTALIGGFLTIALWFVPCVRGRVSDGLWRGMALFFLVILTLFQGLTFLIFKSDACNANSFIGGLNNDVTYKDECDWAAGSTSNVIGIILWFLTGLVMLVTGPPEMPDRAPAETQAVTYELETADDGTTKPVETKVVKGTAVPTADAQVATDPEKE